MASGRSAREDGLVIRVGLRLVAVRSKHGRVWEVMGLSWPEMWRLALVEDLHRSNGPELQRTTDELRDAQNWRELEVFPAPREDGCSYGCCKAGDVGLYSELVER